MSELKEVLDTFDGTRIGSFEIKLNSTRAYIGFLLCIALCAIFIGILIVGIASTFGLVGNTPPQANVTSDSPDGEFGPGEPIQIDASESVDPDGGQLLFDFDLTGDGDIDEDTDDGLIIHEFEDSGDHEVTVTVTDNTGATDTANTTVTVAED